MNITHYMDGIDPKVDITEEMLRNPAEHVLALRQKTFSDFCAVEVERGGIDPSYPLYTTQGQNNLRQLFARMMEELFESNEAESREHKLEELIDALNFGLSMVFLGGWYDFLDEETHTLLIKAMNETRTPQALRRNIDVFDFERQFFDLGVNFSPLLAKLRNRTWQNSAQQPYFGGSAELIKAMVHLFGLVLNNFESTTEFLLYYIAKDKVLQFRIHSKY